MLPGVLLSEQGYRTVLITGTSSGIGSVLRDAFIREGLEVTCISRRPIEAEGYKHLTLNLLDTEKVEAVLRRLRNNPPDIWVNNAGHGLIGNAWRATEDEIDQIRRLLYDLPVELTRFFESNQRNGVQDFITIQHLPRRILFSRFAPMAADKRLHRTGPAHIQPCGNPSVRSQIALAQPPGHRHFPFSPLARVRQIT